MESLTLILVCAPWARSNGFKSRTRPDSGKRKSHTPSADKIMDICRVLDVSPEQLLTGKDIDEDFVDSPIDYVAKQKDEELLLEIHSLKKEQAKRLMAYLKTLKQLEDI
ncbi:hypothetical protein SAMN02910384_02180 [Pseudobutyrivibrio sp. ACV-2]|uniref:hypothetical protein n=1 Tax=Pseudobutyrivibrio sp. ACV-2 TaxID=1520801 RepID=UPI0008979D7A|nr:hypothetical protein [Pseudobutyrivibrio sp. ACV-2]SEA72709.1 hypothetical protein SAMN02910384_02180 [Pseudobutyrivibrio sp. ACV-2]